MIEPPNKLKGQKTCTRDMRSTAYLLGIPSFGECSSDRSVIAFTNIYGLILHDLQNVHNKLYIWRGSKKSNINQNDYAKLCAFGKITYLAADLPKDQALLHSTPVYARNLPKLTLVWFAEGSRA
jgi:hypothetical protein